MNLSKIPLWLYVAVAGLLGLLWWKSRQAVAAKQAKEDQQRQTLRMQNWKLPWEESVTKEMPLLESLLKLSNEQVNYLKSIYAAGGK